MQKELLGSQAPITPNSPRTTEFESKTGTPMKELLGSEAPLSRTPSPAQPTHQGTGEPLRQFFGSEAPLNHTPMHEWQSFPTPMSKRDIQQSKK